MNEADRTLAALPEAVLTFDAQGQVQSANPAALALFGYASTELLHRSLVSLLASPTAIAPSGSAAAWLASLLPGTRPRLPCRRKDGTVFTAELTTAPLEGTGPIAGFACVLRDLDGHEQVDKLKSEFVSVVSHELRTPLTSIRGAMKLIEGGVVGEVSAEALELVRVARVNCDRLVRLVNDILDLERIERGKLPMKTDELPAGRLLLAAVEAVQGTASEAGVSIEVRNTLSGRVRGDEDRLVQVLTNLLSNAVKFSPAGGQVLALATSLPGGRARFAVIDQGPGIAPEQRSRLFQKFEQLDASDARLKGGTGLGLAIARAIVEEHGGRIGVDSIAGQGSTFWVELPLLQRPRLSDPALLSDPSRFTVLVLVADDDLVGELRALLARMGYRFVGAGSLADARALLERLVPDAVLLDARLPDADPAQVSALLAGRESTREVRTVVLDSPRGAAPPPERVVAVVPAPIEVEKLARALHRATRPPGPPRILVVDEDAHFRTVLRSQLLTLGLDCTPSPDGADAVQKARSLWPDLIILDVGIPELDGFGLIDALRQDRLRTTPLIVYSGRDLSSADRAALTLGPSRHLTKARTSEAELLGAVSGLLEGLLIPGAG
jgi:PAS domain S-box-containing protein